MAVSGDVLELEAESTTQALEQFTLTITAENESVRLFVCGGLGLPIQVEARTSWLVGHSGRI